MIGGNLVNVKARTGMSSTSLADEMRLRQWDAYLSACNEKLKPSPPLDVVVCLSCGGTFTRSEDGSIPCGH